MPALLYTNKLVYGSPTRTTTFKTERLQTDSYSIRAAIGINPASTQYELEWGGLTQAEHNALVTQLDGLRGIDTVTWTPPGASVAQSFTIDKYNAKEYPGPTTYYAISATLTREYDPL